jgi:Ni/Co efflux regulator RcnB
VAKHEAYRVLQEPELGDLDTATEVASRRDDIGLWMELDETLATVRELSPRMRETVGDRVLGLSYDEITESRGRSHTNTNRWVTRTLDRLRQIRAERDTDDRGKPTTPPRALRLDQLERRPPPYLRAVLGTPPPPDPNKGRAARLAWRRGARLIERYRLEHDVTDRMRALGPEPADPNAQRIFHATLAAVGRARTEMTRGRERGLGR